MRLRSPASSRSRSAAPRLGSERLEPLREPARLAVEQPAHALEQVLARLRRERADGLVAEDRLEHLLAERRGSAGDHDLGAREAAGLEEDGEHHGQPGAVHAERGEPRGRPPAHPLAADELEDVALPVAHLAVPCAGASSLDDRLELARPRRAPGRPGAAASASATRSAARAAAASTTDSTPGLDGLGDGVRRRRACR